MQKVLLLSCSVLVSILAAAQELRPLTLDDCREMAVSTSRDLEQARIDVQMAGYDKKIARANYFPNVKATGAYLYNNRDIALVSDAQSELLCNAGTLLQEQLNANAANAIGALSGQMSGAMTQLMTAIQTNPALAAEYMSSPMWQTVLQMLQGVDPKSLAGLIPDIAEPVNAIGANIDAALHPDLHNVWAAAVTVEQPLFVGGKIIYANQMAGLAEKLAQARYDGAYADVIVDVDQAYWQIVSIAAKDKLAEAYADLLQKMVADVDASVAAGMLTESDALQVKVKANEAEMMHTKSSNGLVLAKMLLCKRIGLPLDTPIVLADEQLEVIPMPALLEEKPLDDIYADRSETRSLTLASEIYDRKAKVARADLMPQVALVGAYTLSNPNAFNGIQNSWDGGMLSAGVMVKIPLFHGFESVNKYRKARAEQKLYVSRLADAQEKIALQVTQQRNLFDEAAKKYTMAESNLSSAEENLRSAKLGYEAGVIPTNTMLGAQTAWLQAHSEYLDAGIEWQMAACLLQKVEGNYKNQEK
ncbi:MAG: TolC family protein [Bacteroidales bacterium]|nr:TolC family protein [Bacteroidales bacterium]